MRDIMSKSEFLWFRVKSLPLLNELTVYHLFMIKGHRRRAHKQCDLMRRRTKAMLLLRTFPVSCRLILSFSCVNSKPVVSVKQ